MVQKGIEMKLVFATVWSSTSGQNPDNHAGRR